MRRQIVAGLGPTDEEWQGLITFAVATLDTVRAAIEDDQSEAARAWYERLTLASLGGWLLNTMPI